MNYTKDIGAVTFNRDVCDNQETGCIDRFWWKLWLVRPKRLNVIFLCFVKYFHALKNRIPMDMTLMELRGILETAGNATPVRNTRMSTAELLASCGVSTPFALDLLVVFVSHFVLLCSAKRRKCSVHWLLFLLPRDSLARSASCVGNVQLTQRL